MNEIFKIRGYRGGSTGKLQLWIYVRTVWVLARDEKRDSYYHTLKKQLGALAHYVVQSIVRQRLNKAKNTTRTQEKEKHHHTHHNHN